MLPNISNSQLPLSGEEPLNVVSDKQPLSGEQRAVLERLITQLASLTKLRQADLWSQIKQEAGIRNNAPLLSRHFAEVEKNIIQRLGVSGCDRTYSLQLIQLTELMGQGKNSSVVRDFIRAQYGYTALSQLSREQIKDVLMLLQQTSDSSSLIKGSAVINSGPYIQKAGHHFLSQLVSALADITKNPEEQIWQSLLKISGSKSAALIPSGVYPHLVALLQARTMMAGRSNITLDTMQSALKQILKPEELIILKEYAQDSYKIQVQTPLTAVQVQELINYIFRRRIENNGYSPEPQNIQPIYNPVVPVAESSETPQSLSKIILITLLITSVILLFIF
ncbi:flagella biosynthesis regulator Flk [Morganella morganii]|uniref:flagella biosynthesis regulator Flk n=1 Tax=Morganella morganii TaxID=582 RepID=UPI0021D0981B|nr:flagella biosynthesis regulator Flk [Morganella morganii]MCU6377982.1 flagella biosynthesis regulator Flk [Morganella morganii]